MHLERLLQINVAALVAVATLLLGVGQRGTVMPTIMILAAIASVVLTDVLGWVRLNRTATNIAAGAASVVALAELWSFRVPAAALISLSNLLVYLQIILLFQKKEVRTYWLLCLLSLGEAVVAAAFNQEAYFGVLLAVCLATGLSALALVFLHREQTLVVSPSSPTEHPSRRRWPWATEHATVIRPPPGAATAIPAEFWRRLLGVALGTVVIAGVVFVVMPRPGESAWRGTSLRIRRSIGFSDQVQLGELGKAVEDPEEVLRIQFSDPQTLAPYHVAGSVYLRGAILNHYHRGEWSYRREYFSPRFATEADPVSHDPVIRQSIVIEPMDRSELFCVWPFIYLRGTPVDRLDYDRRMHRLEREEEFQYRRLAYELGTTAFRGPLQEELIPYDRAVPSARLLEIDDRDFPRLVALADEYQRQAGPAASSPYELSHYLERMLKLTGRFQYSLEPQDRNTSIDPIEDFVSDHPRGHCEYFATALVLMLRHHGIPARMVVGYRTDEWNDLGGFFQVRQLHAHTWVEAYVWSNDIPSDILQRDGAKRWSHGAWLRLDPTPGDTSAGNAESRSLLQRVDRYLNWLDYVWDNYVMEMDRSRQQRALYDPLARSVQQAFRRIFSFNWWYSAVAALVENFSHSSRWFSWRVGLAAASLTLVIVLSYRGIGAASVWLKRRWQGARKGHAAARSSVEFYHRLETVLARHGLTRPPAQTPREFARTAGAAVASRMGRPDLAPLPDSVVEEFYRVRFGGLSLDKERSEQVEMALARLESGMQP